MGKRPSEQQRKRELSRFKTPPPNASGGFDIKPSHVYFTSYRIRDGQFDYDKEARTLLTELEPYQQAAGKGAGAEAFAAAYAKVADRFLEVWAKSVVSVGGVAVGLTETANNYVAADWFTNKKQYGPPPRELPPDVIRKAPQYGSVTSLSWTGTHDDVGPIAGALGEIPDFLADVIRPAVEHGLNLGRTHEITPGADESDLTSVATAWRDAGTAVRKIARDFTRSIDYLTNNKDGEWEGAMNHFCQTIWGAHAWGPPNGINGRDWKSNKSVSPRARSPIVDVLYDTTRGVEKGCHDVRDAIKKSRGITTRLAAEAAKAMVKDLTLDLDFWELTRLASTATFGELVVTFRSHMDQAAANKAVDDYHEACHTAAENLLALIPDLDEAYLSAPTFRAESARAQAFGGRSLHEFKQKHTWTVPNDSAANHKFPVDLAGTEWLGNSHTVDKHVGLTDDQLAQRLRDDLNKGPTQEWPYGKPKIGASSSFSDLDSAQRYTQHCIDVNSEEIRDWLDGPPNAGVKESFDVKRAPDGEPTGRATFKQDYKTDGMNAQPQDVYGVEVQLIYRPDLNPPFVVLSSMPK